VEIQFQKPSMKYKAGQWLFLNVPSVSRQQWHPFTITSCPFDPYISVHVRQVGDFTRALGDALGAGSAQSKLYDEVDPMGMYEVALQNGQQMPELRIDGPYGAPAEDVFDNEIAVLIGTGIGVTPWAAILKNIWHMRQGPNPPTRLRRVEFIWVCKDTTSFEWFQVLLSSLEAQSQEAANRPGSTNTQEFLRIHTYLTQKLDIDTAQNIVLNSVGAAVDPLTELKSRTNFGRPDFARLFTGMREGILDRTYLDGLEGDMRTNVGVYFCGMFILNIQNKITCDTNLQQDPMWLQEKSRRHARQPRRARSISRFGRNISSLVLAYLERMERASESDAFEERVVVHSNSSYTRRCLKYHHLSSHSSPSTPICPLLPYSHILFCLPLPVPCHHLSDETTPPI
jgi:NADPH oxidase